MITNERIKEIRKQAEAHAGRASEIILELLAELNALRRLKLRTGLNAVSVLDPWPYHPHHDKTFAEVPEDYLIQWRSERSRDVLMHDICLGIIAARDLRLYDLITQLSRKPKELPVAKNDNPVAESGNAPVSETSQA